MIKKLLYGIVLVAGLVSCDDDYTDWANPQSNAAKDAVEKFEMTVQQGISSIDFATETATEVQLFTTNLEEGQTDEYKVIFSAADNDKTVELSLPSDGMVSVSDLENAVTTIYGRAPQERTLNVAVSAEVTITTEDGNVVAKKSAAPFSFKATPNAPFIASAYYLVGDMVGWDASGMVKFSHSSADVYEDPVFTVMFSSGANQYWKIIPQTNIDNADFWAEGTTGVVGVAVNGDTSMSGLLVTNAPQAGMIETAGMYKMTINMMDYSYTIEAVAPQYYVVGDIQGWSDSNKTHVFTPITSTELSYTTKWKGAYDLKFWNANDFGIWDNAYGCAVNGDNSATGDIIGTGAGSISAPSAEYYTFTIDMATMKYTWTKLADQNPTEYSSIGIIGDFNGWAGDVEMAQVAPHNWYVVTTVTDGGLKFRANGGWDISWGATWTVSDSDFYAMGTTANGDNINVPAGTYAFYLNDITGAIEIIKQ